MRFSMRWAILTILWWAILLSVVRGIEHRLVRGEISNIEQSIQTERSNWEILVRENDTRAASSSKQVLDTWSYRRGELERNLGGTLRTLSPASIAFIISYTWISVLVLVVRSERRGLNPVGRGNPRRFKKWIILGCVAPVVILAMGTLLSNPGPNTVDRTWAAIAIGCLAVLQELHALVGIIVLRGRRWAALWVGIVSVLGTAILGLFATMSVTGFAM